MRIDLTFSLAPALSNNRPVISEQRHNDDANPDHDYPNRPGINGAGALSSNLATCTDILWIRPQCGLGMSLRLRARLAC